MKKIFLSLFALLAFGVVIAYSVRAVSPSSITDVYTFRMTLHMPRIYDNMESLGYRQYTTDTIRGELHLTYYSDGDDGAVISVTNLVNKSYKIGKSYVTYESTVDEDFISPRVNLIGNNKKNTFKIPSVAFCLICDPSYNIGDIDEDYTLYLLLSGRGTTVTWSKKGIQLIKTLSGYVTGTMGCGCSAYGHISPTRINGPYGPLKDAVDDVAAVWGTWYASYKETLYE